MTQSSNADHELLDAIFDDSEYDQVFDQCQETQKAARQTLEDAKRKIAASSQLINCFATAQIERTTITARLPQINLPSFSVDFTIWLSFIDKFQSTVNDIDKLSAVLKIMYDRSSLTSRASKHHKTGDHRKQVRGNLIAKNARAERYFQTLVKDSGNQCSSNGKRILASSAAMTLRNQSRHSEDQ